MSYTSLIERFVKSPLTENDENYIASFEMKGYYVFVHDSVMNKKKKGK
jgi:hypothetical protein